MSKAGLMKNLCSLCAPRTHLANSHDIQVRVQFIYALRELRKRDQLPADIGDFVLGLIAHIEQK